MSSTQSKPSFLSQSLATACEVLGFEQEVAQLQGWMQEKVTLMARDICGRSLSSVQTLQQQHRCLEVRAHARCLPLRALPCRWWVGSPQRGEEKALPAGRCLPRWWNRVELARESPGSGSGLLREDQMKSIHRAARVRPDHVFWWQRELAAMEKEVARMRMEACRLGQLHPVVRGGLSEQLAKMEDAWAALDVKAQEQGQQLEQAARGHAFLGRCRELL